MVLIVVILLHYVFMNCEENILRLNVFFFDCTNDFVFLDISELKRRNSIFHNFN